MSLVLYGRKTSANVQKVMWTLGELHLPYRQIELGGKFGGLDTADYRGMNPNSLVPTLKDGEFVLWESHAIVRYLCAKHANGTLWPVDLQARALEQARIAIRNGRFTERGLARAMFISQPHAHNILAGRRGCTPEMADALLEQLGLTVWDL